MLLWFWKFLVVGFPPGPPKPQKHECAYTFGERRIGADAFYQIGTCSGCGRQAFHILQGLRPGSAEDPIDPDDDPSDEDVPGENDGNVVKLVAKN